MLTLAVSTRRAVGALLVVLDGDKDRIGNDPFCPGRVAMYLAETAKGAGAGTRFSVACVFAMKEFESWIVAGIRSLAGKRLPDGHEGVRPDAQPCPNIEQKRDAKGYIRSVMRGYNPTLHQEPLIRLVDLDEVRAARLRSFQRLEESLATLVEAARAGKPNVSPTP